MTTAEKMKFIMSLNQELDKVEADLKAAQNPSSSLSTEELKFFTIFYEGCKEQLVMKAQELMKTER